MIAVDDRGENNIIIVSGANQEADPDLLRPTAGDIVLAQLETPLSLVITAFKIAKDSGATTILNPAPASPLPLELLNLVDYLIPNEHEAAEITGIATGTNDGALAAATELRRLGVETCVLTLGARGALLVSIDGASFHPAFPVTPIDTTAAGDAFCGAFAAALAAGESLNDAITFANASAALTTTAYGAVPSLPRRAAILELTGRR
ncbi:ribokinase [mine drainage metagenome]|uniref:Ribokinase n=1 Tax=mine drainage metagenome TaxID=410659 RepID=A0A1J5PC64_9ZZZZ